MKIDAVWYTPGPDPKNLEHQARAFLDYWPTAFQTEQVAPAVVKYTATFECDEGFLHGMLTTSLFAEFLWNRHRVYCQRSVEGLPENAPENRLIQRIDALESSIRQAVKDLKATRQDDPDPELGRVRWLLERVLEPAKTPQWLRP